MTQPTPGKIFAESEEQWISIAIHADATTRVYLAPEEAYSVARYLEWIAEPGELEEPNNPCPPDVGVWFEATPTGRLAHVVLVDPEFDDEHGSVIALDASRAAILSNQLYRCAVEAALWNEENDVL